MTQSELIQRRVDAAMGRVACDLLIRDVSYLDVFSCEWKQGEIGVFDGTVIGVDPGLKAIRELNAKGKYLVPGFIDAHVHIESSCLTPINFESVVLPRGTTAAVCDPHELANVCGVEGIQYFLDATDSLALDLRVMLSSCVPATHMETNGAGTLHLEDLLKVASHPKVLGLAEMMNVPGVLLKDPNVLQKLVHFLEENMDGHCPLLRGKELSAYAATGISSCHESSELEEAREKLTKGMRVWIREGSVAKDLKTLIPLLNLATSTSLGFCTDDRNPLDIAQEGHIDYLVRTAIKSGVSPEVVYRSASWSVARHYGLDRGSSRIGAIAPGYRADLVLLDDKTTCSVNSVLMRGQWVSEIPKKTTQSTKKKNTVLAKAPEKIDLEGPKGQVHVIVVHPGKIITGREVNAFDASGIAKLTVLERHGHGSKPMNAYVRGFGRHFKGAIASSVGHDSHNLIVVGSDTADMQVALKAVISGHGGFAVVQDQKILAELFLPIGGLMSESDPKAVELALKKLRSAGRSIGCELAEPFLQLAFLSLPVIPSLKLTDKGLVDVEQFKIISVSAA